MSNSAISALPQPAAQARRRAQLAWVLVAALLVTLLGGVASPANAVSFSITGNVKGLAGVNLAAVVVSVYTTAGLYAAGASTDASGNYAVAALPHGSYKVQFTPPVGSPYIGEWWNTKDSFALAHEIAVTAGTWGGVNAVLRSTGAISGRVTGGSPAINVGGATVFAYGGSPIVSTNSALTDAAGNFTIVGLLPNSYTLSFIPKATDNYLPLYSHSSTSFSVGAGSTVTNKNANLTNGSTISGTLRDNLGAPLAGFAAVYLVTGGTTASYANFVKSVDVGGDGQYSIVGLGPASYRVGFTDVTGGLTADGGLAASNPYVSEWRVNKYSFETAATIVFSGPGQVASGINATLENPRFADVRDPSSPFYPSIEWMFSRGISTGTLQPSGRPFYKPLDAVSRQSMALFMFRLSGQTLTFVPPPTDTFADVTALNNPQFYTAIEWMAANNISRGTAQPFGKPLFKPSDPVSRQAMALFISRFVGGGLGSPAPQRFADVPLGASSAAAINWMFVNGISTGTPQPSGLPLYKPSDSVSRQAMAVFLDRVNGLLED